MGRCDTFPASRSCSPRWCSGTSRSRACSLRSTWPTRWACAATTAGGENEFRAVYAGLAGGIALFFALASVRPGWHRPGLSAQLCIFGGLIAARVLSIAESGDPGSSVYILLAGEVVGALLAVVALRSS